MKRIIIAIDGPAGSGKSTSAKIVAEQLGYIYIDTGAMYRAVTLFWLRKQVPLENESVCNLIEDIKIDLIYNELGQRTILNGEDVSDEIRSKEVTNFVSPIATIACVRDAMVEQQRQIGRQGGSVLDGRDIGTVVFPHADLKIYLTASQEARIARRLAELQNKGIAANYDEVKKMVLERDIIDSTREHSPLRKASDAIEIDTSNLSIDAQTSLIIQYANQIINRG